MTGPPNKGMKLTRPERVGALQLIPGVRQTKEARMASRQSAGGVQVTTAAVGLAVGLCICTPCTTAAECPDPVALDQRLDQKLVSVTPGLSLAEFEARVAKVNSSFGVDAEGVREELFLPAVDEGSRTAYAPLWCRFRKDKLVTCQAQLGRRHIQRITGVVFAGLTLGESLGTVEGRLCTAEARRFLAGGRVELEYSMPGIDRGSRLVRVVLRFGAEGRLESKDVR
jgi:hypothetical protein